MLTVSSDKLVAISGISRRFAETFWTTCLAGLWKEDLLSQLVWTSISGKPKPDYCAPSWSWTSIDTAITNNHVLHNIDMRGLITVEESQVDLRGEDPFGEVKVGYLRVKCLPLHCCSVGVAGIDT